MSGELALSATATLRVHTLKASPGPAHLSPAHAEQLEVPALRGRYADGKPPRIVRSRKATEAARAYMPPEPTQLNFVAPADTPERPAAPLGPQALKTSADAPPRAEPAGPTQPPERHGSGQVGVQPRSLVAPLFKGLRKVLTDPLKTLGRWAEGPRASGPRYHLARAVFQVPHSIIDGSLDLAASALCLVEEAVLIGVQMAGAVCAGLLGMRKTQTRLAEQTPFNPSKRSELTTASGLSAELLEDASEVAELVGVMGGKLEHFDHVLGLSKMWKTPVTYEADWQYDQISKSDIPPSILRREDGGTGKALKLNYYEVPELRGDGWSDLSVCLHVSPAADDGHGGQTPRKVHLFFRGVHDNAGLKSAVAAMLGIRDSQMVAAATVVGEFVKMYGRENVELAGHSLGGALATFAGVSHGVRVKTFNGLGLSAHHVKLLGPQKVEAAEVLNFHAQRDPLIQWTQIGTCQIGRQCVVRGARGHGDSSALSAGMAAVAAELRATQAMRPAPVEGVRPVENAVPAAEPPPAEEPAPIVQPVPIVEAAPIIQPVQIAQAVPFAPVPVPVPEEEITSAEV